jgi:hypothetical protein
MSVNGLVCLAISIVFVESSVASLMATLVMLFEMLFGGLLLNKNSLPKYLTWLTEFSFFNSAFEAMIVNEVRILLMNIGEWADTLREQVWLDGRCARKCGAGSIWL